MVTHIFESQSHSDYAQWLEEFNINVIAPMAALRAFTPLVEKSKEKKVVFLTSGMGSVTRAPYMPFLGDTYSTTKAALNMAVKKAGVGLTTLKSDVILLLIHPGWCSLFSLTECMCTDLICANRTGD